MKTIDSTLLQSIKEAAYTEGDFTTRAGKRTTYYIDKYLFECKPEILEPLTQALPALFPPADTYDAIIAPALGAIALGSHLSLLMNKPVYIYHVDDGKPCLTAGYQPHDRVVILEDVLTTGSTVLDVCDYIQTIPLPVCKIISVIDREEGAMATLQQRGFEAEALIKASDFLYI